MADSVKLIIDGKEYSLPVIEGSERERAIDIRALRAQTGHITLDNGFMNTGSCESTITFLNGEKGVLRFRGYPIEQLAESSNFVETALLLNGGELPTKTKYDSFLDQLSNYSSLPEGISQLLRSFPKDAHPMGVMASSLAALSGYYPELNKSELDPQDYDRILAQLMSQVKDIAARSFRHSNGLEAVKSNSTLSYSKDFLSMMFDEDIDDDVAQALDTLLILHADHEQNCSASAVRVIGSSQANVFATVAGGVAALWGQLHGGANQAVLEMLEEIQKNGGDHKKYLDKAKDKTDSFRLMGFGHRVYKNFDPRARIIKKACDTVLTKINVNDPLLDIAKGLEQEALKDDYFVQRNLYPNVDFYSGIIYKALKIPTNMFTVMFTIGRLPGWLAQWKEMRENPANKIARPRQVYTGHQERNYIQIDQRKS